MYIHRCLTKNAVLRFIAAGRLSAGMILLGLLPCFLSGCAVVGPRSIRAGRVAYAEAINQTQDEQILLSIVKGRYGDSSTLLAVNSVVANLKFRAEVGVEAGFGGAGTPGDDLLIGGMAYEENPTISYLPVQGEDYIRQLMSPVPLDLLLLVVRSTNPDARTFSLLVSQINDLRNPDFMERSASEPDHRFMDLIGLLAELGDAGAMHLVQSDEEGVAFNVWFDPVTHEDATKIAEVLNLLELPKMHDDTTAIVIPAYFGFRADRSSRIAITTRSTFSMIEIMRAAVEVPADHASAGLTVTYPPPGSAGQSIRIRSSKRKPEDQSLAVKYRGYWFWIDESDLETKTVFRLIRTLWSISIASTADHGSAPVLTLPVGN